MATKVTSKKPAPKSIIKPALKTASRVKSSLKAASKFHK